MSEESKYTKADFIKFVLSTIDHDVSDKTKVKEYLSSQGLNVDSIIQEGLRRIKKAQLKIEAEKTKKEMLSADLVKQRAMEWVESIMSKMDFSLPELVREESLSVSFRNMEKLSRDDIKNILIKHYTLKFLEEQKNKSSEL